MDARLGLITSRALAAAWLVAALLKGAHPEYGGVARLAALSGIGESVARSAYWLVFLIELSVGVGLLLRSTRTVSLWLSLVLAGTMLIWWVLVDRGRGSCGCFGANIKMSAHVHVAILVGLLLASHLGLRRAAPRM